MHHHKQHHQHHPEDGRHPGNEHRGPQHRGHGGKGGGGRPGHRARRGELRFVLLDTLREGSKHGYEIIKAFEERTNGQYAPSPGTVYPTLQYLEEIGLVRAEQDSERRVYHLTEAGQSELEAHAEEVKEFWANFAQTPDSPADQQEIVFLRDALEALNRTIWRGLQGDPIAEKSALVRRFRLSVESCQNEIRNLLTNTNVATESAVQTPQIDESGDKNDARKSTEPA